MTSSKPNTTEKSKKWQLCGGGEDRGEGGKHQKFIPGDEERRKQENLGAKLSSAHVICGLRSRHRWLGNGPVSRVRTSGLQEARYIERLLQKSDRLTLVYRTERCSRWVELNSRRAFTVLHKHLYGLSSTVVSQKAEFVHNLV